MCKNLLRNTEYSIYFFNAFTSAKQPKAKSAAFSHEELCVHSAVEVFDHFVPLRNVGSHLLPQSLVFSGAECFDVNTLLLTPGEIAKVKDTLAIALVEFDEVIGRRSKCVLSECFGSFEHTEVSSKAPLNAEVFFGAVHSGAIGGDGDDDVVFAKVHVFGSFDGGENIGVSREPE